jgi:hypothetical protein
MKYDEFLFRFIFFFFFDKVFFRKLDILVK